MGRSIIGGVLSSTVLDAGCGVGIYAMIEEFKARAAKATASSGRRSRGIGRRVAGGLTGWRVDLDRDFTCTRPEFVKLLVMTARSLQRTQPVKSPFTINLTPQNLSLECPAQPSIAMNIEQVRFNMVRRITWDVLDTDVLDLLHTAQARELRATGLAQFALMDMGPPAGMVSARHGHADGNPCSTGSQISRATNVTRSGHRQRLPRASCWQHVPAHRNQRGDRPGTGQFGGQSDARRSNNASVLTGDAPQLARRAPYDAIVFTGSNGSAS